MTEINKKEIAKTFQLYLRLKEEIISTACDIEGIRLDRKSMLYPIEIEKAEKIVKDFVLDKK